jgi:hypothetical protein
LKCPSITSGPSIDAATARQSAGSARTCILRRLYSPQIASTNPEPRTVLIKAGGRTEHPWNGRTRDQSKQPHTNLVWDQRRVSGHADRKMEQQHLVITADSESNLVAAAAWGVHSPLWPTVTRAGTVRYLNLARTISGSASNSSYLACAWSIQLSLGFLPPLTLQLVEIDLAALLPHLKLTDPV